MHCKFLFKDYYQKCVFFYLVKKHSLIIKYSSPLGRILVIVAVSTCEPINTLKFNLGIANTDRWINTQLGTLIFSFIPCVSSLGSLFNLFLKAFRKTRQYSYCVTMF